MLANARAIEAALAVTLLAPMPPMMFMGEEWGSQQPFPFFCDFTGALADAVREGRREEFKTAYARYGDDVPDPLAEATFRSAVLDWQEAGRKPGMPLSVLSNIAREAPLGSLLVAFLVGIAVARRR